MKQKAILVIGAVALLGTFVLASCGKGDGSIHAPMGHGTADFYSTIVIDSCEYIEAYNRLAHKGNCRFCTERRRKELNDSVSKGIIQRNNTQYNLDNCEYNVEDLLITRKNKIIYNQ